MSKVSIVLPTYNAARFLHECVESCLNQTYKDIELICVDGGSTDGTLEIIHEYMAKDPRISLINQPANSGRLPGALNIGFAHSTGAFLTWMQADSLYAPHAIETMKQYLDEHPDVDFVYANIWIIDSHGKVIRERPLDEPEGLKRTNIVGYCHLWRRKVYEVIGDHNEKAFLAEDYEYWLRIYSKFKMQRCNEFLYYWRQHPDSLTFNDYGYFESMRRGAYYRRKLINPNWRFYARSIAQLYIEEAFVRHADGDVAGTRRAVIRGLLYNPIWVKNRGVLSILLQSLIGRLKPSSINWHPG